MLASSAHPSCPKHMSPPEAHVTWAINSEHGLQPFEPVPWLVVELYTLQSLNLFSLKATSRVLWEHSGLNRRQTALEDQNGSAVRLVAKTEPLALFMGSQDVVDQLILSCESDRFRDLSSDTSQVSGHLLGPEKKNRRTHGQSEKFKCLGELDKSQNRNRKIILDSGSKILFSESKLAYTSMWLANPSKVSSVCILLWCFACFFKMWALPLPAKLLCPLKQQVHLVRSHHVR